MAQVARCDWLLADLARFLRALWKFLMLAEQKQTQKPENII